MNPNLKGSMGEQINMSPSGPRLSTEEAMRSSAEAYLKGSMEVANNQVYHVALHSVTCGICS